MILFSQNWNPGGTGGVYNGHHTGVWYVSNGRWAIYNEDRAPMPPSAAFNVLVTKSGFIHQATPRNIIKLDGHRSSGQQQQERCAAAGVAELESAGPGRYVQ